MVLEGRQNWANSHLGGDLEVSVLFETLGCLLEGE